MIGDPHDARLLMQLADDGNPHGHDDHRPQPLSLDEYQAGALRTCIHPRGSALPFALAWNALGLTGEAGEVADLIKKVIGHGHQLDRDKLKLELGDVLWYLAALCNDLGLSLSEVAAANVAKLARR